MDQFVDINGIRTRWRRSGTGPPVLVLHGWGAKIEAVDPIIRALAPQLTVYAVDLPGFGETGLPPEPWGVTDYADWTRSLMDELGLERPSIVGHSNGGRIAIHLASHHPERVDKLILVDAAGIRPKRGFRYYRRVGRRKPPSTPRGCSDRRAGAPAARVRAHRLLGLRQRRTAAPHLRQARQRGSDAAAARGSEPRRC